jgi:hypothetical protein
MEVRKGLVSKGTWKVCDVCDMDRSTIALRIAPDADASIWQAAWPGLIPTFSCCARALDTWRVRSWAAMVTGSLVPSSA